MSVVGIDLGTTNSVVACMREGRVEVLSDERGQRLLPSVVSFHPNGEVLVGYAAKARRLVDPPNTIASIKRLIGRPWDSEEIRLARSRFAFELKEGPGQGSLVVARGEAYTLPEVSAFVLKRIKQIAETALGETVDKAVITVPAHFNELQRASTKVAGRVAGLEVLRILNEPTAAALAYGFGSGQSERIAVYDFGGGTFDCSLLDLTGTLFEVLATAGDTFLGGDDIDTAIAESMCAAFLAQHRYDPRVDPQAFEKLRAAAEQLKKDLSINMQAQVDLPDLAYGVAGKRLGLNFGMTQADLDAMAAPFVERTLQVTQDALGVARLSPSSFDQVVLVGGSTRMPLVKRRVEAFFGIPVMDRVNPDEVVAIGAAIQAASLVDASRKRSIPPPPKPGIIGPPIDAGKLTPSPSLSVPTPFGAFFPQRDAVDDEHDHSLTAMTALAPEPAHGDDRSFASSNTLPAHDPPPLPGQAGRRDASFSRANTLNAAAGQRDAVDEPPSITSPPHTQPMPTLPRGVSFPDSSRQMPSPKITAQPNPWPGWNAVGPLETEDISRIMPDALNRSLSTRSPVVGPLQTEDISRIMPDALNRSLSVKSPVSSQETLPGNSVRTAPASATTALSPGHSVGGASVQEPISVQAAGPRKAAWSLPSVPVLVDVTPRALVVETVGGFCDTVIPRNAKIPCEHTRVFATGRDLQTVVQVRVAQGEAQLFKDDMYLGELELSGLRPAPRGEVTLSVIFELDANGSLQVRAVDTVSGREARAAMKLVAVAQTEEEIEEMIERSRSVSVTG